MRTFSYRGYLPQPTSDHFIGPRATSNHPESALYEFLRFPSSRFTYKPLHTKRQKEETETPEIKLLGDRVPDIFETGSTPKLTGSSAWQAKRHHRSSRRDLPMECYPAQRTKCVLGKLMKELRINIKNARDYEQIHEYTEAYFKKVLTHEKIKDNYILLNALNLIDQYPMMNLDELCKELRVSGRQLRRVFKQNLGVNPKTYLRLRRLHKAAKLAILSDVTDLQEIIYECEYYDQSHFARDTKLFTGRKPSELFKKEDRVIA